MIAWVRFQGMSILTSRESSKSELSRSIVSLLVTYYKADNLVLATRSLG
jgi:hypothetical protein